MSDHFKIFILPVSTIRRQKK